MKYLIIGNGVAGTEASLIIKKNNENADITIIDSEKHLFYYRPRLIDHLAGKIDDDKIIAHKQSIYDNNNINIIKNTEVVNIDIKNKIVICDDNTTYKYDKLLIATGASPLIPSVELEDNHGVFEFRDIEDSHKIREFCTENKGEYAIIGGGLLGIETANAIMQLGCDVRIIEFYNRILPRQLDEETSNLLEKKLSDKGIKFNLNCSVDKIETIHEENSIKKRIVLKNGESIVVNGIIFSTGICPKIELFKQIGILTNRGVIVNEFMETNIKDIYAAGDIAEFNSIIYGLWLPSKKQGEIAGENMSGNNKKFESIPMETRLKVTGINLFSVGDFNKKFEEIKTYDNGESFKKYFINNKKLEAAIIIGDNKLPLIVGKVLNGREPLESLYKLE